MATFQCPVCKWKGLTEDVKWPYGSHEICECCGTQFGLDVQDNSDIVTVRDEWISQGAEWFSDESKPNNWSLESANKQIQSND